MSDQRRDRMLQEYRADFEKVCGQEFKHFYCPILNVDEPADLCLGHIVNEALVGSSRDVVLQRGDVDNFYGSAFEADFVALLELKAAAQGDALIDPKLSKKARPRIEMDGRTIHSFPYCGKKSEDQIVFKAESPDGRTRDFVMKIDAESRRNLEERQFRVVIDRDCRISALASLLKAAHLSLFHVLGYEYVFTSAGQFLGKGVLGRFFRESRNLNRDARVAAAYKFFMPLCNMVRPVDGGPSSPEGFIDDNLGFACESASGRPFALGVVVRSGDQLHTVLVPADPLAIDVYFSFLKEPPTSVIVRTVEWSAERQGWLAASGTPQRIPWTNAFG